ncbi:putative flavoprotein involved in K+ transport [Haloactinopolyspora alba]|uniref:Putative flavoprotein involved in K+ transport n=1 Tax=Haloactinopolyspora alba TaxID=648780 RepID=A0A2P8E044_9ACTN|nr:NAD(P)-binding domain-containing protein [Haloactinopolyspora alba]PSL02846.1 putative flavoprotein involved in K+ transport [Haloactinopolyspora alba]
MDDKTPVVIIGGGQSGLAAAAAGRRHGTDVVVLEVGDRPVGTWPAYYDSLTLLSPARYSALPGLEFPGDPDHHPHRDDVVAYLERYASTLGVPIRTGVEVEAVEHADSGFLVRTADGQSLPASGVVSAAGSRPVLPELAGQDTFRGELTHIADYRNVKPYVGRRVVVVGSGESAVQIAHELGDVADVTLTSRRPVRFLARHQRGQDVHHWSVTSGFDRLPPEWLAQVVPGRLVNDAGEYERALGDGRLERRAMFSALDGDAVVWADGTREHVDAVLLATGYAPRVDHLAGLGALDEHGLPLHSGGLSTTTPGLGYLGLEFQRSFASNTLRGVGRDAEYVMDAVAAYAGGAAAAVGLSSRGAARAR